MCGIAGIIGPCGPDELETMTQALAHRGPNASGIWREELCALGHRRLSILDLSDAANQPMHSQNGRYAAIYNGEVYNFKEISKELNIPLNTTSDTEVVLEAFVQWGNDFVKRLNGMFAIAIWDKELKQLHLFRDRMGIKPLYYSLENNRLMFSSELKSFYALPAFHKKLELDRTAMAHYLHCGFIPEPYSIWNTIKKFPKGHYAVYKPGRDFNPIPYWRLVDQFSESTITDELQAGLKLEELLVDSVRRQMMSDVPFGAFLSGGIDSSLVTAIAQSQQTTPLHTFTIGFEEEKFNEMPFARKVAEYLGTDHHEYTLQEKEAIDLIPGLMSVYDEPFADDSAIPTLLVSKIARQHVTMTLSGDGGDECFMGYNAYRWAQRLNHPLAQNFSGTIRSLLQLGNSRMKRAAWLFEDPLGNPMSHLFSQEQYLFSATEVRQVLSENYTPTDLIPEYSGKRKLTPTERQAYYDLTHYLPEDLLVKVDRASMHYGLETRVPLLDHRIVEFALNLDQNLKMRNGESKYLLKKVLFKYVPANLFDRPKWGFSIPLSKWMRSELNTYVEDTLHSEILSKNLGISVSNIPGVKHWRNGQDLYYYRVWQLVILGQFLLRSHQD